MKRLPKYKTDPKAAYNYAKKHGPLPEIEEKVFFSNFEIALDYAIDIKKSKLCSLLEQEIFKKYLKLIKKSDESQHEIILNNFFKYIKITKEIPEKYFKNFLDFTSPEILYIYASSLNANLPKKYEYKMFQKCMEEDDLWPITEYQYVVKKVPDYMHNFMIAKSLEEKSSSNKNATLAYFLNLKKLKNILKKLYNSFENKNITLKEAIDQL